MLYNSLYCSCMYVYICVYAIHKLNKIYHVVLTEFHTNGNWEYSAPVLPGIYFHNSQLDNCHVSISATS